MLSILRKLSTLPSKPHLLFFSSQLSSSPSSSLALSLCPGCGIQTQNSSPSLPGFFILPSPKSPPNPISPFTSSPQTSLSLKSGLLEHTPESPPPKPLICARCHSLRHYGRVKNLDAENLLAKSDFESVIASKIASLAGRRSVVLLIVDAADFDGSFPRKVALLLSAFVEENALAWKEGKPANVPRMVVVVTKIDLLPCFVCRERVEKWVRLRAGVLGAGRVEGIRLVSAVRDWGVRSLMEEVTALAGPRGNVWAVGAQNAGKSTLINAMGRCVGGKVAQLTEAPVPGTTLGVVRVEGVLGGQAKLFDTPGIVHHYQITTRLNREEQKLVHISKELKPRTYRIKVDFT